MHIKLIGWLDWKDLINFIWNYEVCTYKAICILYMIGKGRCQNSSFYRSKDSLRLELKSHHILLIAMINPYQYQFQQNWSIVQLYRFLALVPIIFVAISYTRSGWPRDVKTLRGTLQTRDKFKVEVKYLSVNLSSCFEIVSRILKKRA